jgi:hypothetical protein
MSLNKQHIRPGEMNTAKPKVWSIPFYQMISKREKNPFFSGEEKKMQRVVPFSPVNHKH